MADNAQAETVERDGKLYGTVKEGKATILVPQDAKLDGKKGDAVQQVFYNPIQQYNRDLSVLAIKTFGEEALEKKLAFLKRKGDKLGKKRKREQGDEGDSARQKVVAEQTIEVASLEDVVAPEPAPTSEPKSVKPPFKILDALSASGLRALRYAHELPFVTSVIANDLSAAAAKSIKSNVNHNGLDDVISVTNEDALAHMYRAIADDLTTKDRHGNPGKANKFDVIDLDPYGTAAPFFDAAVQAVRDDGGLLCVTCTDSAIWAGHSYCEKTFALYGGTPIKGPHSHEAGLRLILNGIATSAARYGLAIEPLLSLSIDFYTKVFVKVTKSPQAVKFLGAKTMMVYSCDQGCGSWETQFLMKSKLAPNKKGGGSFYKHSMAQGPSSDRFCAHCGSKTHINGPMYGGHIHSPEFINRLLDQIPQASPEVYKTLPRLEGMLRNALEECIPGPELPDSVNRKDAEAAVVDHCPFYVVPGKLASVVSCAAPGDDVFRGALIHLGYQVGRSHCRPGSVKTDAPFSTIWWIMAEWIRQKSPIKTSKFTPNLPGWKILFDAGLVGRDDGTESEGVKSAAANGEGTHEVQPAEQTTSLQENGADEPLSEAELRKTLIFDDHLTSLGRQRGTRKLVRYQQNPRANWGPLARAAGK